MLPSCGVKAAAASMAAAKLPDLGSVYPADAQLAISCKRHLQASTELRRASTHL